MKTPKKFAWKISVKEKRSSGAVMRQEQCSSGSGGNGKCGNK